jgi:acetyl esterase/lipase
MKLLLVAVAALLLLEPARAQSSVWQPSVGHTQIRIWPGTAPDLIPAVGPETVTPSGGVQNVSQPTITFYSPKKNNTGAAILVFPGGGYKALAMSLEGTEVCDWLTSKGITCVLVKYRVPFSGPYWDDKCKCHINPQPLTALQDAQRAVGMVRQHAAEWHIDPHRVGVLGFSAGGHLVAAISTHFEKRIYPPIDEADKQSCRPDFAIALYPGHLWTDEDKFELTPDMKPTRDTPTTFLAQAENDDVDDINHSLVYYIALKNAGVPVEMHLYAEGGHAFGLRRSRFPITLWPDLVETWLRTIGMTSSTAPK